MRGWIELIHAPRGKVSGAFVPDGDGEPVEFFGWLDLLRVLEGDTPNDGTGIKPAGSHDPRRDSP